MGFFYNGGGERTVLSQAHELQRLGHNVKVYAPTVSENCFPGLQKGLEIIDLNKMIPENLPYRSAIGMICSSLKIPYKEFKNNDILIAHAQPSNWIAYTVRKKYKIPYIAYLHQVNRFFRPRNIDKKTGWNTNKDMALLNILHKGNFAIQKIDDISIKKANLVLTNSKWIKKQIKSYYGISPVICYPGVEVDKFKLNKSKRKRYILSTNRHYPQKRIDHIIGCMNYISKKIDDVKCIITGKFTNHTKELLDLVNKLDLKDKIIFTGNVSSKKLVQLYREAYTYAFTSPEEDFGLGPLESGSCGTPSIVWNYAGPKETVINGITGYRINPYNIKEMSKYHIYLLENDEIRKRLGLNAYKYVNDKYTWNIHCNKILECINKIKRQDQNHVL